VATKGLLKSRKEASLANFRAPGAESFLELRRSGAMRFAGVLARFMAAAEVAACLEAIAAHLRCPGYSPDAPG
jgi:hypothetical protein